MTRTERLLEVTLAQPEYCVVYWDGPRAMVMFLRTKARNPTGRVPSYCEEADVDTLLGDPVVTLASIYARAAGHWSVTGE